MATFRTRWFLSILLVILPNSCVASGPPTPPSNLDCYIPCNGGSCGVDIHCTWDSTSDPQFPTDYILHWESKDIDEDPVTKGTSLNRMIERERYPSHSDLYIWVQAKNQYGSVNSNKTVFNTGNINKPSPPKINKIDGSNLIEEESLEISWSFHRDPLSCTQKCDVQHRTEDDPAWIKTPVHYMNSFPLDNPQPCKVYEFQVRCGCNTGLMSDWTAIQTVNLTSAPIGELDLWMDCGFPTTTDCFLTWKRLPFSQACGYILGYEVTLFGNNGPVSVNVSTTEPGDQLVCDDRKCYLSYSLKDILSARVSAYNAHGATRPSHLTIPTQGKQENAQNIHLNMNEDNLTVSWNQSPQLFANPSFKEYVVQYKQVGSPLCQEFDWVKVGKDHTMGILKGQFKKYTPYQVTLFTVSDGKERHHQSSVIGYSLQGTPSIVAPFKVVSISATDVTLSWESEPLSKQKGVILYYQIGLVNKKGVYKIPSQQHKSQTFTLQGLSPDTEYVVWINAVTQAGPGDNATVKFQTHHQEDYDIASHSIIIIVLTVFALVLLFCCVCNRAKSKACRMVYEKVPDPHNSRIFKQMKYQINDPLAWSCISINEQHPKISQLEIVEIQPSALESSVETTSHPDGLTRPAVGDGSTQIDCQDNHREDAVTEECDRIEGRYRREEYSKMVDSDEERDGEEDRGDSWSSSEEEQFTSGYEKHFMPTPLDVLEV